MSGSEAPKRSAGSRLIHAHAVDPDDSVADAESIQLDTLGYTWVRTSSATTTCAVHFVPCMLALAPAQWQRKSGALQQCSELHQSNCTVLCLQARRRWVWATIGLAVAAATVLAVVLPTCRVRGCPPEASTPGVSNARVTIRA